MKQIYKSFKYAVIFGGISFLSFAAHAQQDTPIITSVETNYAGLGAGFVPDYMGSDEYTGAILPAFRYEFGNHRNVELIGNYVSANLVNNDVFKAGPALRYRFGRDDDVDDEAVKLLPEIDDTLEAGVTGSANWVLNNDPRNRFAVGADAMWDTSDTHEGFNSTISARYWMPVATAVDAGIAGNIQYGDDNFTDTYFSVGPGGSAASGLPVFEAEGGVAAASITPMAVFHLSERWHIGGGVRYQMMLGDAADSPIVDDRGDENQFMGGVTAIYTWGAKTYTR